MDLGAVLMTKTCRDCGIEQPLSEFYLHPKMSDGHLNKCKTCVKSRIERHRKTNIDRIRGYDRSRSNLPHRVAQRQIGTRRRRLASPDAYRAQSLIANAVRSGILLQEPCMRCGRIDHVHAHHEDYSKPMEIIWLCPVCHRERHRGLGWSFNQTTPRLEAFS